MPVHPIKLALTGQYGELIAQLKARRKQLRISQEELEFRIGLTPRHIEKYENGRRAPNMLFLAMWCEALQLELHAIPMHKLTTRKKTVKPNRPTTS